MSIKLKFLLLILLTGLSQASVGLENALDISASGAHAQRVKAQVIAENIANIDTTKTSDGLPYRRKVALIRPNEDFSRRARTSRTTLRGVRVVSVEPEKNAENN